MSTLQTFFKYAEEVKNVAYFYTFQIDVHPVWVCMGNFTTLAFNPRFSFTLFNRCGGAVAVRAMTSILGENALNADRSLNSLLNSSFLIK